MTLRSFSYVARGKVQGVSFRAYAKQAADRVGVMGWIQNDTEGNVIGVAQGEDAALSRFKGVLSTGPRHATVSKVEYSVERDIEWVEFDGFHIRR